MDFVESQNNLYDLRTII